jgi:threonine/homoserine/homoserine lactone efflux protein
MQNHRKSNFVKVFGGIILWALGLSLMYLEIQVLAYFLLALGAVWLIWVIVSILRSAVGED